MNGLSHVVRQRITSVRFRGRSSKAGFQITRIRHIPVQCSYEITLFVSLKKLRRLDATKNELVSSLVGIDRVKATSDVSNELDFTAKIDSLVNPSVGVDSGKNNSVQKGTSLIR